MAVPTQVSPASTIPLPLLSRKRFTDVIPVVNVPVPEAVKVTLLSVAVLLPGLLTWICTTGKVTPGN